MTSIQDTRIVVQSGCDFVERVCTSMHCCRHRQILVSGEKHDLRLEENAAEMLE